MNPPKPTAMKILQGTARPDRMNPDEPTPELGAVPPPWLPSEGPARAAWDRLAPGLVRAGILTKIDGEALGLACLALEEFLAAREDAAGWRRADAAWKRYAVILREFGLTPSSRTRVHAVPPPAPDPLAEWEANR